MICDLASYIGFLVMAFAGWRSSRIVLAGFA